MTAVIGILNKRGVAIAADSAVTRIRQNTKVTKNGNKMIRLSNVDNVCVMLTGNGEYFHTQWDIIVRYYRQHRGDIHHDTVEECVHDFFKYIADNHFFCDEKAVKDFVGSQMSELFDHTTGDVNPNITKRNDDGLLTSPKSYLKAVHKNLQYYIKSWSKSGSSEQFKDYTAEQFHSYTSELIDELFENNTFVDGGFNYNNFPKDFLESIRSEFEKALMTLLTTRRDRSDEHAELVFTGYGEKQNYPSLVSAVVFEGFDGRVNYHIRPEDIICISDDRPVAICPFAQKDIIRSLLRGIHTSYSENLCSARDMSFTFNNDIFDIEEGEEVPDMDYMEFREMLSDVKLDDLNRRFVNAGIRYLDSNQQKWEKALRDYDLVAMAALAQSLIELTGFHRILHFYDEGVGGPVDLAVITKTEGFTWLNRKSWYHHKDIGGRHGALGV
jgi:hypothetical protein